MVKCLCFFADPTDSFVTIASSGEPVVGESLSFYCLLQLPENTAINSTSYSWSRIDTAETLDMMGSGSESDSIAVGQLLEFNPLNASSGGMYECMVSAQLPNGSSIDFTEMTNLTVTCKLIVLQ